MVHATPWPHETPELENFQVIAIIAQLNGRAVEPGKQGLEKLKVQCVFKLMTNVLDHKSMYEDLFAFCIFLPCQGINPYVGRAKIPTHTPSQGSHAAGQTGSLTFQH